MRFPIVFALCAACSGSSSQFQSTCTAGAPSAESLKTAGRYPDGSVILPDGMALQPAGKVLPVGGFPLAMRLLSGGRYVIVTDGDYGDEALRIVDLQATNPNAAVVSKADYVRTSSDSHAPALFYGLVLDAAQNLLYVSDGGYDPVPDATPLAMHHNVIERYKIAGAPPQLTKMDDLAVPFDNGMSCLPAGIALGMNETQLYVACQGDGSMRVLDLTTTPPMEIGRAGVGLAPYEVVPDGKTVYVTLWGGFNHAVVPVDVSNPHAPMPVPGIAFGNATEGAALDGNQLFVASSDDDTIGVIDTTTGAVASLPTGFEPGLYGSVPNAVAVDRAGKRLYVANAGENAVQVFSLDSMMSIGRIPTAWYPTAIVLTPDSVVIASAKGLGAGPTEHSPDRNDYMQGVLQVVPTPSDSDLMSGDQLVHKLATRMRDNQVPLACTDPVHRFPLPEKSPEGEKDPTPIKHVFLVVRENKTYDAVLGDLPTGNGRASLVVFGQSVTPNLHALASRFTNLDNFYSLAEQSLQGHEWTTANFSNDYSEKGWNTTWGRATRPLAAFAGVSGVGQLAEPKSHTVWQHLDAAQLDYHNYGEVTNTGGAVHIYDSGFPGVFFDTDIHDVDKAQFVIGNLADPTFTLEPFSYVLLPNDHTVGTQPGKPTPDSMVADNDEATGRLVDAISHSKYWASSIIFIIEDDPQDGGDHVELHRSPCVIVSPWVKSGYTSSVLYNVPALWRTITLLLGTPPINQRDAHAAAMYDVFSTVPDLRPYTYLPRSKPEELNAQDAPLADESMRIDFSKPDQAPLGRILWKATHGRDAEPPWGLHPLERFRRDDDD